MSNFKKQSFPMPVKAHSYRSTAFDRPNTLFKKRHVIVIVLSFLFRINAFTQQEKIDSLTKLLPLLRDSARVDCLNKLGAIYQETQTDSALFYSYKALSESNNIQYAKGVSEAFFVIGLSFGQRADYRSAEKNLRLSISNAESELPAARLGEAYLYLGLSLYAQSNFQYATRALLKADELFKKSKDVRGSNRILFFLALNYEESGLYEKAFELCVKSLKEAKKDNDQEFFFLSLLGMGRLYQNVEDYQTALEYYQQASSLTGNHSTSQICSFCSLAMIAKLHIGEVYFCLESFDSSKFYLDQVFTFYEANEKDFNARKELLMSATESLGELYLRQKNYDKALANFSEPMRFFSWGNNLTYLMRVLLNTGKAYAGKSEFNSALDYARRLLFMAKQTNARKYIRDGTGLMWSIYDRLGSADSAYKYYLQYAAMKDSLLNVRYIRQLSLFKQQSANEREQLQMQLALQKELLNKKIAISILIIVILLAFIIIRIIMLKRKNEAYNRERAENELQIQKLESERTKAELQQQTTELEMQALRAQMNPHFIFNSLNSINRFILKKQSSEASEYLTKFSRLIRLILQNSQAPFITLESELEALQLYLELEAVRFDHQFEYRIIVDEDIDESVIKVPPLIIQPYAENAIWHGLMHKEEKGFLEIKLFPEDGMIYCRITDNGIGRKKASELKSKSVAAHKSMGLRITADRIARLQRNKVWIDYITISDLALPDGSAAGTEVIIKIPVIYD
jgi:tetratricopeptide (TPR) repeat protein